MHQVPPASTLAAVLHGQASQRPHAAALLAAGRPPLSYAALWQQVRRTAGALQSHGIAPSERVALVLPNGPEAASAFLGVTACAGCAPLNPAYAAAELRFSLEDVRARAVLIGSHERGPVREVARALGLLVLEVDSDAAQPAGQFELPRATHAEHLAWPEAHDTALLLHTSGTTGRPKLVPLRHANLVASALQIAQTLALAPADRCLNVMPLFHIHGLVGALLASLVSGSGIVCTPGFDARFFDWIAHFEPTWYSAVPTIHQAVLAQGERYRQAAPGHRFRFVRSSSAALPPSTLESLQALTGAPVIEAYGMTEASHQMASNPLAGPRKAGSVGLATGVDIALLDGAGRRLGAGAAGEIVIRGPGVTAGYENHPAANAEAFVDGWFRTGDLGRIDDDGYLYVTGRIKDIVNRGGEKISPREVDEALLEHPDVQQAVAFAAPHPTLGEDLMAAVVLRKGASSDEASLRNFLRLRLAEFKVPSRVVAVDAIPAGATGKVQRAGLYDKLRNRLALDFAAPQGDLEQSLCALFGDLLGGPPVGRDDNFFSLGGDSLKGAQVMARLRAQHGVDLAVPVLFSHPSAAALAAAVQAARAADQAQDTELEAQIDALSDEEVERLLAQEEAKARWTAS